MFLECTLIQWILSIYSKCTQEADGTIFMKSPVQGQGLRRDIIRLKRIFTQVMSRPFSRFALDIIDLKKNIMLNV